MVFVRYQKGIAALLVTMIVLSLTTIVSFLTARVLLTDHKVFKNVYATAQAENAAQAGFDYALAHLNFNQFSVTDGQVFTTGSPLPNGATYSATYTYVTTDDPSEIVIASTGTSTDGSSIRTVQATVKRYMTGASVTTPVAAIGNMTMRNQAAVHNNVSGATSTILLGGTISITNTAATYLNGVLISDKNTTGSDISENVSSLSSMSTTELQNTYVGYQLTDFSSSANINNSYAGSQTFTSTTSSSSSNNWAGQLVYLNMNNGSGTATFNDAFYAGTTDEPAIIVVNGNVDITGSGVNKSSVFGSVYATGSVTLQGDTGFSGFLFGASSVTINTGAGAQVVAGSVIAGSSGITLENKASVTLQSVESLESLRFQQYAVVSGSWKDF